MQEGGQVARFEQVDCRLSAVESYLAASVVFIGLLIGFDRNATVIEYDIVVGTITSSARTTV